MWGDRAKTVFVRGTAACGQGMIREVPPHVVASPVQGGRPCLCAIIEAALLEEKWPWEAGWPLTTYSGLQMALLAL